MTQGKVTGTQDGLVVPSVCPHDCPSVCALDVELDSAGQVGRLRGAAGQPYTAGVICTKVAGYRDRLYHPERLMQPLKRVGRKGEGDFVPVSWDEALDTIASRFRQVAADYGAEAVWPYSYGGTMGLVQRGSLEMLRNSMGYSRQAGTICIALASAGYNAGAGARIGTDARELSSAEVIVLWGCNAVHSQIHVMTQVAAARKSHQAKVVVVDPYRTPTAEKADLHLMLRPGTDAALACAVMHVLFAEGMADRDWMARFTDDPAGLEQHVASRTPEWASAITGLPASQIVEFARLYGSTRRSFLKLGYGFTRSRNGASSMHAALCLPSVTGAWAVHGGGALYSNSSLFSIRKPLVDGSDREDTSVRRLDMSRIGPVLTGDRRDLGDGPPVMAMLVQNTNPAVVAPDSTLVRQGLGREDLFLVVHEQFMTETARYADIVLPATMFLEHADLYTPGAHTFLQCHQAVVEPPGECRSNRQVVRQLAARLGVEHPGLDLDDWAVLDRTLRDNGYPGADELLEMRWLDCGLTGDAARMGGGFSHKDRKFHFRADWQALGPSGGCLPEWPDYAPVTDQATADRPFRLMTPPARNFLNTTFTEIARSRQVERQPTARIHPRDARALQLKDGQPVAIGNERGVIHVAWQAFDGLQQGVVVIESVWPNRDFPGGKGVNTLVSAEAGFPNGGAVFHDTAVWLRPLPADSMNGEEVSP